MIYRSLLILCVITASSLNADEVSFTATDGGATIHLDGKQFATFVHTESPVGRPYISNLFTTDHIKVTRNHPTTKDDPDDHPHHQGIFFTWGQLNGLDYWHMRGRTVHDRFLKIRPMARLPIFQLAAITSRMTTSRELPGKMQLILFAKRRSGFS